MPMPLVFGLVVFWFALVGYIVAQARKFEYDYSVLPEILARRRERALKESAWRRLIHPMASVCAAIVPHLGLDNHRARIRRQLQHSGNPAGDTAETFIGTALTQAILAGVGLFLVTGLIAGEPGFVLPLVVGVGLYFMPILNLQSAVERRRVLIDRHIPFFLDLMVLTMGAGSTFLEACKTITSGTVKGPLVEELDLMVQEVSAGTRLTDALKNMTRRSDSEELGLMVQAVVQGEELGTPMVEIFETQADTNRYRRTKRGEQLAAKLPNRLAIPNTILMFAVLLLLFGPIIVKAFRGELM